MDNTKPTDIKSMLKSRFCIVTNLTKTASYWLKSLSILNSVANTISHRQTIGSSITNTKGIVFWYERVSWNEIRMYFSKLFTATQANSRKPDSTFFSRVTISCLQNHT